MKFLVRRKIPGFPAEIVRISPVREHIVDPIFLAKFRWFSSNRNRFWIMSLCGTLSWFSEKRPVYTATPGSNNEGTPQRHHCADRRAHGLRPSAEPFAAFPA